ncbi:hypothetical protein ACS0TY_010864 [Phlomoides rotata]
MMLVMVVPTLLGDQGEAITGHNMVMPNSIHPVNGSPFGITLFLVLVPILLNNRVSIFTRDDDSDN